MTAETSSILPQDRMTHGYTSVQSTLRILHAASRWESRQSARARHTRNRKRSRNLFLIALAPLPFSLLFGGLAWLTEDDVYKVASLGSLLLVYTGLIIHPLIDAYLHRETLAKSIRHPFGVLLRNVSATAAVDLRYFPKLCGKSMEVIRFVHMEARAEREYFERRLSLVVGAVDKLGLMPGLLAASLSLNQVYSSNASVWILGLAYATPALYVFAVMAHHLLMQLDRAVKLLDYVIEFKKR